MRKTIEVTEKRNLVVTICDICQEEFDTNYRSSSCNICKKDVCSKHFTIQDYPWEDTMYCYECWEVGKKYIKKIRAAEDALDLYRDEIMEEWTEAVKE